MTPIKNLINKIRRTYFRYRVCRKVKSYKSPPNVNGLSLLTSNTRLGENVNLNGMVIIGNGEVDIGDNLHSGADCLLITEIHNYDEGSAIPYDNTYIYKKITIEDNVWLGSRVILLGGVTIGEGAIIQAGGVVVKDIPKYAIAGGNPAKVFKHRNIEHYNKLKNNKKFY